MFSRQPNKIVSTGLANRSIRGLDTTYGLKVIPTLAARTRRPTRETQAEKLQLNLLRVQFTTLLSPFCSLASKFSVSKTSRLPNIKHWGRRRKILAPPLIVVLTEDSHSQIFTVAPNACLSCFK